MAATFSPRFRDPKSGRFTRNDGRHKLTLEIFHGNKRARIEDTKRYKQPTAREILKTDKRKYKQKFTGSLRQGSLSKTLGSAKIYSKIKQAKLVKVTVTFKDATGRKQKIRKEVKLATTGKKRKQQNRAILMKALLPEIQRYGVRFSSKKFRTGAAQRTPTARQVRLTLHAA